MHSRDTDVLIVGAGLAGLTTARELTREGVDVLLLEAQDEVGGKVRTAETTGGQVVELGPQWVGPDQTYINNLITEYGIETFPHYTDGKGQLCIYDSSRDYLEWPGEALAKQAQDDLRSSLNELDELAEQVPLDSPSAAPQAEVWDGKTVETWIQDTGMDAEAREALRVMVRSMYTSEPSELSLLFFLFHLHSCGGFTNITDPDGGGLTTIVSGAQQLTEAIADEFQEHIRLEWPVQTLKWESSTGVTASNSSDTVTASYAIVAVNPSVAAQIDYEPSLPTKRRRLTQNLPNGSVIKTLLVYDQPFWREQGFSGEMLNRDTPLTALKDSTPPDADVGVLAGFISGAPARDWNSRSEGQRREMVTTQVQKRFNSEGQAELIDYLEQSWVATRWTGGCFYAHAPAGSMRSWETLREPVGPIHWAGAETATEWMGHMDGAVRSGKRAANEVFKRMA